MNPKIETTVFMCKSFFCDFFKILYKITLQNSNKVILSFKHSMQPFNKRTGQEEYFACLLCQSITSCLSINVCGFWGQLIFLPIICIMFNHVR